MSVLDAKDILGDVSKGADSASVQPERPGRPAKVCLKVLLVVSIC